MSVFHNNILAGASGAAGGAAAATYVDDVFSTFLYTGTGASHTIANGIDLSGEGGLVWIKQRNASIEHFLFDTERGATKSLSSNDNTSEYTSSTTLTGFGSTGFTLSSSNFVNGTTSSPRNYCSWTFRKAPGFFDCVTFTGTGSATSIAHNLGSVPGMVIVRRTDASNLWAVYHRSTGDGNLLKLNESHAAGSTSTWNNTTPTSTHFSVGTQSWINGSGGSYVAYLFAHNDQSFGTDSDEAIVKCDSYTGSGSQGKYVEVGFEPQWLMIKRTAGAGAWKIVDMMRGMPVGYQASYLQANEYDAEFLDDAIEPGPTGFTLKTTGSDLNSSSETYIYVAIRRPHKPPEAATDVFAIDTSGGTSPTPPLFNSGFVTDFAIRKQTDSTARAMIFSRLQGGAFIRTDGATEVSNTNYSWDFMNGFSKLTGVDSNTYGYLFRRAPGFMDVVAYSGNSTDNRAIAHNLTVKPELLITHGRNFGGGAGFALAHDVDINEMVKLTSDAAKTASFYADDSSNPPTATHYKVSNNNDINETGRTYVTYMFATLAGISKVGSYTGTGSNINVDCGFTAGARFVLIKRFDSTGDWYVFDSSRGIVGGNDPYWVTSSDATQVTNTDYIDPLNSGFTVTSSAPAALNASGGTYIFLAIA